jgi:diamine N-acetyltransferase
MLDPATKPGCDAVIALRAITKETLHPILKLEVAERQKDFVASNAVSIAQAHFEPEAAWFRAIYADETPVGFVMVDDDPVNEEYGLWRFMIDQRYQGLSFGRRALQLVIDHIKTRPGAKEFFTSCVPGDGSPCPFYEKMGFVYTGEVDDGELVMRLVF